MNIISNTKQNLIAQAQTRIEDLKRLQQAGLICKSGEFFPSVHYPPITMYPPVTEEELFAGYTNPPDGLFDIYIHIPFCERRCVFCHYPLKLGKGQSEEKDRYLAAQEKEMDIYMRRLGINRIHARSILVGGGTPTFLTLKQQEYFFEYFLQRVDLTRCTQFNFDVDPGSLIGADGIARLKMMKNAGVDRLTIGVQSLDPDLLKKMNRPHTKEQAIESIRNSMELGLQVNIEFIFGYPNQTLESWIEVMEEAVQLGTDEIQLYRLKIDAYGDYQGPIKNQIQIRPEELPSLEDTITMKQLAIDILGQHGYHENMRRVFSKKTEHYSHYAHNQCCMLYDEIGFGLTAFSSLRDRFVLNTQYFDEYYAKIAEGKLPLNRGLIRNNDEQMRWAIVLPLKNRDIHKEAYQAVTGTPFTQAFPERFQRLKEFDLLEENTTNIKLTKLGAFFADEVAESFHSPKYVPFPASEYAPGPLSPYPIAN